MFPGGPSPSRDPTLLCVPQLQVRDQAGLVRKFWTSQGPPST